MSRSIKVFVVLAIACHASLDNRAAAQYAVGIVSYDAGSTPTAGFTTAFAALGSPERFTGEGSFPTVVSPFSPPFLSSEIVSVGEGGHITLRLSHYAVPQAGGPEIGVFENVGLIDTSFPDGVASSPAMAFGIDSATVDVSADGMNWVSLGNVTFDVPVNGYTDLSNPFADAAGNTPSDFQRAFSGDLNSFSGLRYSDAAGPDMLDLLAGSGGGKWLDISGTGLSQVGFVRFSVSDDMDANLQLNFELDAVSIARAAMGTNVVPEPATVIFAVVALAASAVILRPRQCSHPAQEEPVQNQAISKAQRLESSKTRMQMPDAPSR
jgi:hypothetical protein